FAVSHRVQIRCNHQIETHTANFIAHHFLSLQCDGNDVGKRPVITNRSGQDEVNAFVDAAIKYPALNEAAFNRLLDAPRPPYGIDGPEMMLVTFARSNVFVEINTEGGAVKRRLDIVHGQAVACEQDLNIISFDQPDEMARGAGMHEPRARHNENTAAFPPDCLHRCGDF